MSSSADLRNQSGFSLIELMITLCVMLIVTGSVLTLFRDSLRVSITAYEMSDAQESLRTAQEYINRDLLTSGDGLKDITNVCLPSAFVTANLTKNPNNDPCGAGVVLPMIQSDDSVPAGTVVPGPGAVVTVRTNPSLTDRITMLQLDPGFPQIGLVANAITLSGLNVRVAAADINRFNVGEIYFFTSSAGATFATVTGKNVAASTLTFANGDQYGLNQPGAGGLLNMVSGNGLLPTSVMRMRIISYFVNQNGLLIKRVFGVGGGVGYTDSVIAEHVVDLQFRYIVTPDIAGAALQPVAQLTPAQQLAVNQVEVRVTTETAHAVINGTNQSVTMTTTTSVRNIQFIEAQKS